MHKPVPQWKLRYFCAPVIRVFIHNCVDKQEVDVYASVKMGVVVGSCGYYSKSSGKKWVTPPTKQKSH